MATVDQFMNLDDWLTEAEVFEENSRQIAALPDGSSDAVDEGEDTGSYNIASAVGNAVATAGPSWIDNLLTNVGNTIGPAALSYGIEQLFPGSTSAQRQMAGYQGGIPEYDVLRARVPNIPDPTRRPGSGGQRYFTDTQYVPRGQGNALQTDATAIAALNAANPAREVKMAGGGIAELSKGRYLGGATDGMADKVPANIDGQQEARLSHGEFVVPADVVSHLGNGNSDAGAKSLYSMMDRIRKARTGNKKQGKKINARKMLPA